MPDYLSNIWNNDEWNNLVNMDLIELDRYLSKMDKKEVIDLLECYDLLYKPYSSASKLRRLCANEIHSLGVYRRICE